MLTYRLYYIYVLASKLALHLRSIFVIVNVLHWPTIFYFLNVVLISTTGLGYFCTAESGNGIRFSPSGQVFDPAGGPAVAGAAGGWALGLQPSAAPASAGWGSGAPPAPAVFVYVSVSVAFSAFSLH